MLAWKLDRKQMRFTSHSRFHYLEEALPNKGSYERSLGYSMTLKNAFRYRVAFLGN